MCDPLEKFKSSIIVIKFILLMIQNTPKLVGNYLHVDFISV